MASGINIYSLFWISKIIILDIQKEFLYLFGYPKIYLGYPEYFANYFGYPKVFLISEIIISDIQNKHWIS